MYHKFTNVEKNAMASMLGMGMSVKQVAESLGLKYDQVYSFKRWSARQAIAKVQMPEGINIFVETKPAVATKRKRATHTDAEKNAMAAMLASGLTIKQTADKLGLEYNQVKCFKYRQKMREASLAAQRAAEAKPAETMADTKPVAAADSGNIVQIDLPLAQGERIVRVPIKLKLDISVA